MKLFGIWRRTTSCEEAYTSGMIYSFYMHKYTIWILRNYILSIKLDMKNPN